MVRDPRRRVLRTGAPASGRPVTLVYADLDQRAVMTYETAVPVGRGATGEVAKAFDPALRRTVALKFLRSDDPDLKARMVEEARCQARVSHPNVCPVYEVGEMDGRTYIAMQYIEGEPLDEAARDVPLERKITLLKTVADAVHAAHAAGLIHRDLKPSNILVARADDGELTPFVLDFGIAREQAAPGLTATGQVLGTPGYMAPEQARGEVASLDRRVDVFSLGVLLYELISGRLPFEGDSGVEILVRLLGDEPPPLRQVAPWVPRDLETVTMKCLERDPSRRYDSARAVAEDLDRYLRGEPIVAKPAGALRRARSSLRRHRLGAAVVATAAVLLMVTASLVLHERWRGRERERLAREFGQRIERLESLVRHDLMLPLHDVRPARERVRHQIAAIEREITAAGPAVAGVGHAALGRAYLALGNADAALGHLRAALRAGQDDADLHGDLGVALGSLYRHELETIRRIDDPDLRRERRAEADLRLRQPALDHLERARGAGSADAHYVTALLALLAGDWDAACREAEISLRQRPWFAEALLVEGEARLQEAQDLVYASKYTDARAVLGEAERAYAEAAARERSNPAAYAGLCRVYGLEVKSAMAEGQPVETAYERATAACDQATAADPASPGTFVDEAVVANAAAQGVLRRGQDPTRYVEDAVASASEALQLAPDAEQPATALANAHLVAAQWQRELGKDPLPALDRALDALRLGPDGTAGGTEVLQARGSILFRRAQALAAQGSDPVPAYREAADVLETARSMSPRVVSVSTGLGAVYSELAYYLKSQGLDASDTIARSIAVLRDAAWLSPANPSVRNNLGLAYWTEAESASETGRDPTAALDQAVAAFERAHELDPSRVSPPSNLVGVHYTAALDRLRHGRDPSADLGEARRWARTIAERLPFDHHFNLSEVEILAARWTLGQGGDPTPSLERAEAHARAALALHPDDPECLRLSAGVSRWWAEWLARGGDDPEALARRIDEGLAAAGRALRGNPRLPEALVHQAALQRLAAGLTVGDEAARHRAAARAAWARALEINPRLQDPVGDDLGPAAGTAQSPNPSRSNSPGDSPEPGRASVQG